MAEKLILGNIITLDESMPRAEAVAVLDGIIVKVGSEAEARAAVSEAAEVIDYRGQWVYPGFLEPHSHGMLAGLRAIGQANLATVMPTNYEKYEQIMRQFIADHPEKDVYVAAGWIEDGTPLDHSYLDAILPDKPLVMNTGGGHGCLLNRKAMEHFGIDDASVEKYGTALVHVDSEGHPDGYICEEPAIKLIGSLSNTMDDVKGYLLNWQEFALSKGVTAVADAGVELMSPLTLDAYKELADEGKLVVRNYAYLMAEDNTDDPAAAAEKIAKQAEQYNGEYFKVVGIKAFLDGVIEAHTGWLLEDYADQPGYHGVERFNDPDKMVELLTTSQKYGLSVHVHSEGDGATHFMLDCIEKAQEITGDKDQRNMLAHLHLVSDEDIQRMADTHSIAAVAPLWSPALEGEIEQEIAFIGEDRNKDTYPIKSFIDRGAKIVFHSDYPISQSIHMPMSVFIAKTRGLPDLEGEAFENSRRNTKEAIDCKQSLLAVTRNVAYAWREEDRMGSITSGKLANFTVVDMDLLDGDVMTYPNAKVLATIVDGNVVYKA